MEFVASSMRPEKRRRLMNEPPGSIFEPVKSSTQNNSDERGCNRSVGQRIDPARDGGPEGDGDEMAPLKGLVKSSDTSLSPEIVCFGAINTFAAADLRTCGGPTRLQVGPGGQVYQYPDGPLCGAWANTDTDLLDLLVNEGLQYDLHWIPEMKPKGLIGVIWVTIYGGRQIAADLGETLQTIEMFLQDPIYAEQDVVYWNPHKYRNDHGLRTSQLKEAWRSSTIVQNSHDLGVTDILEKFVSEDNLPETEGSPYLRTSLKSHQKRGLTFMTRRERGWQLSTPGADIWTREADESGKVVYRNNIVNEQEYSAPESFRGGILSDQMGLGKSLGMLALVANDKVQLGIDTKPQEYSTLIVVPPQLMANWEIEIEKHTLPGCFQWYCHHGPMRHQKIESKKHYDIVITTYSTLAKEWQAEGPLATIFMKQWHRIILDEAHFIKDINTVTAQASLALQATCRWAVTGTPVQNGLSDIFSLFRFIKVYPYSERSIVDQHITNLWTDRDRDDAVNRLKTLLQYIMLRRPADIIRLPHRTDRVTLLRFDAQEGERYRQSARATIRCLDDLLHSSATPGGYTNVVTKINALRMACNMGRQRENKFQDTLKPPNVLSRQSSVSDSAEAETGSLKGSERLTFVGICKSCGVLITNSESLIDGYSRSLRAQTWCPSCLLNLTDPVEDTVAPPETLSEGIPGIAGVGRRQWPTKIRALLEDLQSLEPGTKCVIFSSWTSTLDLVESSLAEGGISWVRFDGKTSNRQRKNVLQKFSDPTGPAVLLMSIQCGAVGLNLTAASRAYLMEPHWNPAIEEQALARIHRLGQTRPVVTIRLVIQDSIEEYVREVQSKKKKLISLLLASDQSKERKATENEAQELRRFLS